MLTSASRESYSPDRRVRTSISSSAFVTEASSDSASARVSGVVLLLGQLEEDAEVVDAAAQGLGLADLGLEVGELAGDLLRRVRVVPQGRRGRLLLEHGDVCPQLVEVQDGLDRLHGRGEGLQLFGYIDDCHGSSVTATRGAGARPRPRAGRPAAGARPVSGTVPARRARASRGRRRRVLVSGRSRRSRVVAASWPASRPPPTAAHSTRAAATPSVIRRLRTAAACCRAEPGRGCAGRARGAGGAPGAAGQLVGAGDPHARVGVPVGVRGRRRAPAGPRPRRRRLLGGGARRRLLVAAGCCSGSRRPGSSTSSGGIPARSGSSSRSRAASSEARSREAGALARHCTSSCHSSSGMPGSGTTVSVTWRRSTAPGWPPPNGVNPASSSYSTVASA